MKFQDKTNKRSDTIKTTRLGGICIQKSDERLTRRVYETKIQGTKQKRQTQNNVDI